MYGPVPAFLRVLRFSALQPSLFAALLLSVSAVLLLSLVSVPVHADEDPVTRDIFAMDTYMTVSVWGERAEEAAEQAVAEIHRLDALLSTGKADSEVSRINAREGADRVTSRISAREGADSVFALSEDSAFLMERSLGLYEETGGAFDITVYPLMELWGFTDGGYRVPSEEELQETLPLIGSDQLVFDRETGTVSFSNPGTRIDFGGIAKGYTSQRIMDIFREYGVSSALLSLGGNVQALGLKTNGKKWKVAIQSPDKDGSYLGILEIADQAVITSGGYERFFEENGVVYHHILDPRTGRPADSHLRSVTIVSDDGTLADGLSTSLFVMGAEKAAEYWRAHRDEFQMVLFTDENELLASDGLRDALQSDLPITWVQ